MPQIWVCASLNCSFRGCAQHMGTHPGAERHPVWLQLSYGKLFCCICNLTLQCKESTAGGFGPVITALRGKGNTTREIIAGSLLAPPAGSRGLKNLGNTCYLSAAVHALSHCPPLSRYLRVIAELETELQLPSTQPLLHSCAGLLRELWDSDERNVVTPTNLVHHIRKANKVFRNRDQHDSHELLRWLLDALHEETKVAVPDSAGVAGAAAEAAPTAASCSSRSVFSELFQGQLVSECRCMNEGCGHVSKTFELFTDLSLPIPDKRQRAKLMEENEIDDTDLEPRGSSGWFSWFQCGRPRASPPAPPLRLHSCLAAFFMRECLTGDERIECDSCKTLVECEKSFKISKLPPVLCLHVKRFKYNNNGTSTKLSDILDYPQIGLDLSSFCNTKCRAAGVPQYTLFGVVSHSGGCHSGHYVAHSLNYADHNWYCFDDAKVTQIDSESLNKVEPYILFYTRQEDTREAQERQRLMLLLQSVPPAPSVQPENFLISAEWFAQWSCLNNVCAMPHHNFLCPHGQLNIRTLQTVQNMFIQVPPAMWSALQQNYSGVALSASNWHTCSECEEELETDQMERAYEKQIVTASDSGRVGANEGRSFWFIISSHWLGLWRLYTAPGSRAPLPGPVCNHDLLDSSGVPLSGLKRVQHYRGINEATWNIFIERHGGGPTIRRTVLDIYGEGPDDDGASSASTHTAGQKDSAPSTWLPIAIHRDSFIH